MSSCDAHLARAWLLARLSGHLDRVRADIGAVLALDDDELIDAVAGQQRCAVRRELAEWGPDVPIPHPEEPGLPVCCPCDPAYPARLRALPNPPAVLHLAGRLAGLVDVTQGDPVSIVGARRASPYGLEMARSLAAGLATAGVPVISGMALGIDCAAHSGALERDGTTVTVLPSGADRPYPASRRSLYRRIVADGAVLSELPRGTPPRNWTYPARNRIIAGLAAATVVVEAGGRSGALLTAGVAEQLGRPLGAVPGRVGTAQAAGPNALLAAGATVIRGVQDVLDLLYGAGVRTTACERQAPRDPELRQVWEAIAAGNDTSGALAGAGISPERSLVALAELELAGHIRRQPGGRFAIVR